MEYFDVVDENGQPTGDTVSRKEAHEKGIAHRTAHVWLVRERAGEIEILLQKRSQDKDAFPGQLDTSSAGHIPQGEEPADSALRELKEELGVLAEKKDLHDIGHFFISYDKVFHGNLFRDREYVYVYYLREERDEEDFTIQKEELDSVVWQKFSEVYEARKKEDPRYCVPLKGLEILKNALDI